MSCAAPRRNNEDHQELLDAIRNRKVAVCSDGKIYRAKRSTWHRADWQSHCGYRYFTFKLANGRRLAVLVHRLVVRVGTRAPIPEGMQINHRNGDTTDNRLKNLEIVSPAENARHARDVLGYFRGERNPMARLSAEDVAVIRQRLADGDRAADVALDFGVSQHAIRKIKSGERWAHTMPMAPEARPS